jgi:Tfp pilus assembly protein PilX
MFTKERLMQAFCLSRKGMALYLVLTVLIVVVIIAGMFLNLVLSQGRLTHHQVSRTQAYFAARMGMNYAIEMLSRNDPQWLSTAAFNRTICSDAAAGCTKTEPNLPPSIRNVTIYVGDVAAGTNIRPLNVTVNYAYQQ